MPFGFANAPPHFRSLVNSILRDIIGVYVVVYVDDLLIFSNTTLKHSMVVRYSAGYDARNTLAQFMRPTVTSEQS